MLSLGISPGISLADSFFDTTRTTVPKSFHPSSIHGLYEWVNRTYLKDDFETSQQYHTRMTQTPVDPQLRAVAFSPNGYSYDDQHRLLTVPLIHKQLGSAHWTDLFIYGHADDLGMPVDYGLSVPKGSAFGRALVAGDTIGIQVPVEPAVAEDMRTKRVDCLIVFRLVRGEESSPLWVKTSLQPGWDNGPEMYTWRYFYTDVVGLWLFDQKKRNALAKFYFVSSSP